MSSSSKPSSPDKKPTLEWMYEGASSSINREDYLTGKKIDRQFERSNADFHEPPSKLDHVIKNRTVVNVSTSSNPAASTTATTNLLDLETIKKEDPLVAIKVREEKLRREILENPVKMKRLQKIVMQSMEKKMRKFMEKRSRQRGSSSSSSSSSASSGDRRKHRRDRSPIHRRESSSKIDRHPGGRSRDDRSRNNRSPIDNRRGKPSSSNDHHHCRQSDRSPPPVPTRRQRHDSSDSSSSSSSETARKSRRYGLIHVKERKDTAESLASSKRRRSPSPVVHKPKPIAAPAPAPKKYVYKPMSEEEMEKKRREMMENAKWRDEQRLKNVKRLERDEIDQATRDTKQKGEAVDFIRAMVTKSTEHDSVEGRVKSKIQRIQRSSGAMDSNFVRK